MMKTIAAYALFTVCAFSAFAQGAGMKQYKSIDGKDWVCTTSAVSLVASEAALRVAGDLEGSNNVTALSGTVTALSGGVTASNALFNAWFAGIFPKTNDWNSAFSWGNWAASVASNTAAIAVLQTNTATKAQGALADTAWQNPASATNWTWISDGTEITLTGYMGPADVVIPDKLDNLPVTGFGVIFGATTITSVSGGDNITTIANSAFSDCEFLATVDFPAATTLETAAFANCSALASVSLPSVTSIGVQCFSTCSSLRSVTFRGNAPTAGAGIYQSLDANQVTNYVTSSTATGWGATFGGMPVVRMPVYADSVTVAGTSVVTRISNAVNTHVTDGTHTNVTLAGTVNGTAYVPIFIGTTNELPIIANRTNGVLYVEIP